MLPETHSVSETGAPRRPCWVQIPAHPVCVPCGCSSKSLQTRWRKTAGMDPLAVLRQSLNPGWGPGRSGKGPSWPSLPLPAALRLLGWGGIPLRAASVLHPHGGRVPAVTFALHACRAVPSRVEPSWMIREKLLLPGPFA